MTVEQKRSYNAQYMRRYRANPANAEKLRVSNHIFGQRRKERLAARPDSRRERFCSFCHIRRRRTTVSRLTISASGEFSPITLPYCGQC